MAVQRSISPISAAVTTERPIPMETAVAVKVDGHGHVYVAGDEFPDFPGLRAVQQRHGGGQDAY